MPKFHTLQEGTNEALLRATDAKVAEYLGELFDEHEYAKADNVYSFAYGTVHIEIRVIPYHSEDVLVQVFSYLADQVTLSHELAEDLLRLNTTVPFGSFGLTFDGTVKYAYSVAGANLDFNEFMAAVQTVATIADEYDEKIRTMQAATA